MYVLREREENEGLSGEGERDRKDDGNGEEMHFTRPSGPVFILFSTVDEVNQRGKCESYRASAYAHIHTCTDALSVYVARTRRGRIHPYTHLFRSARAYFSLLPSQ